MGFTLLDVDKEIERRKQNPKFERMWDESREEYRLIGEMIKLRRQEKITQSRLAELTGNKQQVISRIEKREQHPTLKMFCKMLDALGYEIKIEKKQSI